MTWKGPLPQWDVRKPKALSDLSTAHRSSSHCAQLALPFQLPGARRGVPFPGGQTELLDAAERRAPPSPTGPAPRDAGPALPPASQAPLQRPREGRKLLSAAAPLRVRPASRQGGEPPGESPVTGAACPQPRQRRGAPGRETRGVPADPWPAGFCCRLCPAAAAGQRTG